MAYLEVFGGESGFEGRGQIADVVYGFAVFIQRKYLTTFPQEMDEIAAVSAAGVEYAHPSGDVSSENLIEDVDVDLAELFLDGHGHD
jgi:hypothetical protein